MDRRQQDLGHHQLEHSHRLAVLEANYAKVVERERDLDEEVAAIHRLAIHAVKTSEAAVAANASHEGWFALSPWAKEQGVHFRDNEGKKEGRIISAMCWAHGVQPIRYFRQKGQPVVNAYPLEMLWIWLASYGVRKRQVSPTLFIA